MNVRTRIAPSPTGYLHFGLARTALFSYLFAKKHGGSYVVRIEDTDKARSTQEFETDILEQFAWLSLTPDATYRQSEHVARHRACLTLLIEEGKAYVSREPSKDDPSREVEVIRLRNAGETITFTDLIRGDISFDTTELGDFVIARSMDDPLYHLAVVIDDYDEEVTHVIRGEDHISNTPRQILIQKALGFSTPQYAHLPLILMPDKSKMSKRKHETSVRHYRELGILPEALLNYVALLGWTPPSGKEILSLEEMAQEFELSDMHKNGAMFDLQKLRWVNKQYLERLSDTDFLAQVQARFSMAGVTPEKTVLERALPALRERIEIWDDLTQDIQRGEWAFLATQPTYPEGTLVWKKSTPEDTKKHLQYISELLSNSPEAAFETPEKIKELVWGYAEEHDRGSVLWPMRFALTGLERSPDPFTVAYILGKSESCARLAAVLTTL